MDSPTWIEGLPVAVTVTSADGTILAMNERSREAFSADGGGALVGRSVFDCHPEPARAKTHALFASRQPNHYTICKNGQKKIIHQLPWFEGGVFAGFVEISIPVPDALPHFDRGRSGSS
jgi:transcriptional regulator with PAS, ATPase and Fis domain